MNWIETEHLGYAIRYAENEDVWRCEALSLDAKTLSALKSKMGKTLADARRIDPVPVLIVTSYGGAKFSEANAILPDADGLKVWCMVQNGSEWRKGERRPSIKRELHKYSDLIADTPEARAALASLDERWAEHRAAGEALKAERDAIPRIQPFKADTP